MRNKVVGIIGGMGPSATVDLMTKIIRATPAKKDQEHIRMLVDNNPHIPPRVEAIMEHGESPGPVMAEMASNLEKWGADFIVIACSTAHFYLQDVLNSVKIPVLNMIEETIEVLKKDGVKNTVLLATIATLKTKLYEKVLNKAGINLLLPEKHYQEKVLQIIKEVKTGHFTEARAFGEEILKHSLEQGAEAIILGCTELPVIFDEIKDSPLKLYDPTEIMAQVIVKRAT
ncbi:MAG: amino acid racemase [Dehalobacterium sp.]